MTSNIIRVKKESGYFAVSNVPFNDNRLSWESRGVLGYLLSKPDGWQVSVTDLIRNGDAKGYKVSRILKELENCGYLTREKHQDKEGKFYWISTIYEVPPDSADFEQATIPRKPGYGEETIPRKPRDGVTGNAIPRKPRDVLSTKLTSNKLTSNKVNLNTGDENEEIETFLKKVPESTRDLAKAFCYMHGRPPIKSEEKYWRRCWNEQLKIGLTGDLIIRAYAYMDKNHLTVRSPQSLNAVAERIKRDEIHSTFFVAVPDPNNEGRFVEIGEVKYPEPKSKKAV